MNKMTTRSMTGFAAAQGSGAGYSWSWDIRAVNARGLDIRMRLPDWIAGLEPALRPILQGGVARGSVSLALKVQRDDFAALEAIDGAGLDQALGMIDIVETAAQVRGVSLTPASAADVLGLPGVVKLSDAKMDVAALRAALVSELPDLLRAFNEARSSEGAALAAVMVDQFARIAALSNEASIAADKRKAATEQSLRENLARVLDNSDGANADRVAQELAMIAVKNDVTEEIDRLLAHVAAAGDLLASDQPVGRKLDFLAQEFLREANTLCSKAQSKELTRIGLELKAVIEQMREQVQNVE